MYGGHQFQHFRPKNKRNRKRSNSQSIGRNNEHNKDNTVKIVIKIDHDNASHEVEKTECEQDEVMSAVGGDDQEVDGEENYNVVNQEITNETDSEESDEDDKEVDGEANCNVVNQEIINKTESEESDEDDPNHLNEKDDSFIVNSLLPEKLIKLNAKIKDNDICILIDTGAKKSFVNKNLLNKMNIYVENKSSRNITGYGNNVLTTLGIVNLEVNLYNKMINYDFNVLDSDQFNMDVIFGTDLLRHYGVLINMKDLIFQIGNKKDGKLLLHLDKNFDVKWVQYQNIPMFSQGDFKIGKGERCLIPVSHNLLDDQSDYYFEGRSSEKFNYYCGVMTPDTKEIMVENMTKSKKSISKGEYIGTVSTLLQDDTEVVDDEWSMESLKEKVILNETDLDDKHKNLVYDMLYSVNAALSKSDNDMGDAKVQPHRIVLNDETPIWQKPRVFAPPINKEIELQCQDLLDNNIIEHSSSSWSSPCVPVRKSDGSLRLCIDYRKLNAVTKTDKFPMPNLNHCIYRAYNMKYFTKLDLVKGYYQIKLDEDSKQFTAFSTLNQHYQFKRLAFGLKNSGIAFQKAMQHILAPLLSHNVIVYIDDILISSPDFDHHINLVQRVLCTLAKYNTKIKLSKCEFFKSEVQFLGHIINVNGISKSPEFIKKISNYPKPTNVTELRRFLGLINFQRKFIPRCAEISKPLTQLTGQSKKTKIEWNAELDYAYERLKKDIENEITLTYPDYSENAAKLELFVDASSTGAGACLMQRQKGVHRVIGYASMTFSQDQIKTSTIERELSAIRWGCHSFKAFISGIEFLLYTDHEPLTFMNNMASESAKIGRITDELSDYNFKIRYLPGSQNEAADVLSRVNDGCPEENIVKRGLPKELRIWMRINGGGDSMFESVLHLLRDLPRDDIRNKLPLDHSGLRKMVIEELMKNKEKYKIDKNKREINRLKIMLKPTILPSTKALLAIAYLFDVEIRVYHNMEIPVIFTANPEKEKDIINLQCISYIHYNPLIVDDPKHRPVVPDKDRYINSMNIIEDPVEVCTNDVDVYCEQLFTQEIDTKNCCHSIPDAGILANYGNFSLCALVDTGAQVSLIGEDTFHKIKTGHEIIENNPSERLRGIVGKATNCIGIVHLNITVGQKELTSFPFAIVKQNCIPHCLLLGVNFISGHGFRIDFTRSKFWTSSDGGEVIDSSLLSCMDDLGSFTTVVGQVECESLLSSDGGDIGVVPKVRFMIPESDLKAMQSNNHALRVLRKLVFNVVPVKDWKNGACRQFKRYSRELEINNGMLIRNKGDVSLIVVSYAFMVEIAFKVHSKLAHIGRHKLIYTIMKQFWHPAIDDICRDLCRSCSYCQFYKANIQHKTPPLMKINSVFPFNIVAIDLLKFPISKSGNVAALVAVDHFSKWLCAVALCCTFAQQIRCSCL